MKYVKGDLIRLANKGEFDVIAHGCNCFCNMGKGIAKQIKVTFPEVYNVDLRTNKGDRKKLGNINGYTYSNGLTVVNCYTQFHYGKGLQLDYEALESCLRKIKGQFSGKRIGLPMIGCGLAGGSWWNVREMMTNILGDEDVTVVEYDEV